MIQFLLFLIDYNVDLPIVLSLDLFLTFFNRTSIKALSINTINIVWEFDCFYLFVFIKCILLYLYMF